MKVFITGSCGFVGTNLVLELSNRGYEVVGYDIHQNTGQIVDMNNKFYIWGDIRDKELLEESGKDCDATIHLAALSGIQTSLEYPMESHETNVTGTVNCLEAAKNNNHSKFIFASSGGTVLGHQEPPVHEEVPVKPISLYGSQKASGESYCLGYNGSFGSNTTILRFSNVYGPYIRHKTNLVPNILKAFQNDRTFCVYGDGNQSRDFVYVKDLVDAIILALESEEANGEIYQLATGEETSVNELVAIIDNMLRKRFGRGLSVEYAEGLPGEVQRNWADIRKIGKELGWHPKYDLEEGLRETMNWFWKYLTPKKS